MSYDDIQGFSWQADSEERGSQYPRIWWHNGVKQAQTNGSFYTSEREFSAPLGEPWQGVEKFDDEQGYQTSTLRFAVIRKRVQAYSEEVIDGNRVKTWHDHWKQGRKLYTELLGFIEGYEGLVIWPVKGLIGKAITAKGSGIIARHKEAVIDIAAKTWKGQGGVPPWAFWIPITAPVNAKGKPEYTDTGYGSFVTLPQLALPATVDRAVLGSLFVGKELLEVGLDAYHDHSAWQKELHTNEGDTPTQAEPPRNQAQAIHSDDEDLAF